MSTTLATAPFVAKQSAPVKQAVSPADVARQRAAQVTAYAINRLYHSLPAIILNLTLMPLVVGMVLWNHVSHVLLGGWIATSFIILAMRYALSRAYAERRPADIDARRWANYFTVTSLISGITWGLAGMFFFVPGAVGPQVFLYICIIGLAAGSIIVTSYWLPAYYAYALPSVSLSAARLAYEGSAEYQGLAVLILMYFVIITKVAHNQKQSGIEAVRLRFENLDLVEQLRGQKQAADDANIAKSRFLAAASHDLRQPLHALGLFVASLNERIKFPEVRSILDNINGSVAALEGLFNALLDVSRLDAGIVQPKPVNVRVDRLFEQLASEYAPQARARGLGWHSQAADLAVYTDPALLETILRNLVSNAIRYTLRGEVRIGCASVGAQVHIDVADTGIGIAPEHQQEIFREFFQLQNPERDRSKGLGLGLAIVSRLGKLLDHPIEVRSIPDAGSVFRITLPLGDTTQSAVIQDGNGMTLSDDAGKSVLVIDDETAVRDAMFVLLTQWGYEVLVAASPEEALLALQQAPDVIIADYRLREGQTGAEAIRRIHAAWGAHIPALIVTGDTAPERLREARASGFAFLHKPVEPAKLRAFLRNARLHSAS